MNVILLNIFPFILLLILWMSALSQQKKLRKIKLYTQHYFHFPLKRLAITLPRCSSLPFVDSSLISIKLSMYELARTWEWVIMFYFVCSSCHILSSEDTSPHQSYKMSDFPNYNVWIPFLESDAWRIKELLSNFKNSMTPSMVLWCVISLKGRTFV